MKRKIIQINEEKCTGCGDCIPGCPEGALQVIDGKARLVSDINCDGLGACIGDCPVGAIHVVEREAEEYNEKTTLIDNIIPKGKNTILAHLKHLKDHGQTLYLNQAIDVLKEKKFVEVLTEFNEKNIVKHGVPQCPSTVTQEFKSEDSKNVGSKSELTHWPIQLHLINPASEVYLGADLLVGADCTAFTVGDFHSRYLKNKKLIMACPKLDSGIDVYIDKIRALIDDSKINTITLVRMQVPCCGGLLTIIQRAMQQAKRKVPVKEIVINIKGNEISNKWI